MRVRRQPPYTQDIHDRSGLRGAASCHLVEPALVSTRTPASALGDVEYDAKAGSLELISENPQGSARDKRARLGVQLQRDRVHVEPLVLETRFVRSCDASLFHDEPST